MPQGSVLGPQLFLVYIYINDLQNNTSLNVLNFADDTLLYTTFKKNNHKTDTAYLNSELNNLSKWLKDNRLKLNTDKTRYMLLHSGKTEVWKNTNLYKINMIHLIKNSVIKNIKIIKILQ